MSVKNKRNRLGLTLQNPSLVQRNDAVQVELPQVIQSYERQVQPDEIKLSDGTIIKKPQYPTVGPDNSTRFQEQEGERKYKDNESAKERQEGKERTGKVLNEAGVLMEPLNLISPSRIYGAYDDWKNNRKGFLRSWREGNQGFGNEGVNLLVDFLAPMGVAKALKLGKYFPRTNFNVLGIRPTSTFQVLDQNLMRTPSRVREPILPGLNTDYPVLWERVDDQIEVPLNQAKRLLSQTTGQTTLSDDLVDRVLGERNIRIVHGGPDNSVRLVRGPASEMEDARDAFRDALSIRQPVQAGQRAEQVATVNNGREALVEITPRNISAGEEPYKLEDLVDIITDANGNQVYVKKPNLRFGYDTQTVSGTHGMSRWNMGFDTPKDTFNKYLNATFKVDPYDIKRIVRDNPINRSGIILETGSKNYSVDSMWLALKMLEKNLKAGRKYVPLKHPNNITHVKANTFGQKFRYNQEFSDELKTLLKNNDYQLPEGFRVNKTTQGQLVIEDPEGRIMGQLNPRSNEDIINQYNEYINRLNDTYKINIKPAKIEQGQIMWPEVYGLLYKKGGAINKFKTKMKFQKRFNNMSYGK